MRRSFFLGAITVLSLTTARAQAGFGKDATIEMPEGTRIAGAILTDIDGDGLADVVLSTYRGDKKYSRDVRFYKRRAGDAPFGKEPDRAISVPQDACAFAVGDLHEDAGKEIVVFGASSAHALRLAAEDKDTWKKIADVSLLWQFPGQKHVLDFSPAVSDLNHDGLDDLLIPEDGGYRVLLQSRGDNNKGPAAFSAPILLRVPDETVDDEARNFRRPGTGASSDGRQVTLRVSLGGGSDLGPLLSIEEACPAPLVADVDGDGDLDILAQGTRQLFVWKQSEGKFSPSVSATWPLPVAANLGRRLDVSYRALGADIDGDKKLDGIIVGTDQRADSVRSQVLLFMQGKPGPGDQFEPERPLYGSKGIPRQLLVIGGFAGAPALEDVDGDGKKDLVIGSLRVDSIDGLRSAASDGIEAELYVYRCLGDAFSRTPDVTRKVKIKIENLSRARRDFTARFIGDVTGDGLQDLLVRRSETAIDLYMLKKQNDQLVFLERAVWQATIDEDARIIAERTGPKGAPEILVVSNTKVVLTRFRP